MDQKSGNNKKSRRDRKADNEAQNEAQSKVENLNKDSQTLHTTTSDVDTVTTSTTDVVTDDIETTRAKKSDLVDLDQQDLTYSLAEEQLQADVYEKQIGTIAISKRTEELPVEGEVDVDHDEVEIDHKEINEPVAESEEPWYDGDTLVIPVYEEVLVTEKHLYLKEEIRVTRVKTTEQVKVHDTVRRQVVDVTSDISRPVDQETTSSKDS